MLNGIKNAFGDFLDGLLGGLIDKATDLVENIIDKLGKILEILLSVFDFIPSLLSFFNKLLRAILWMLPDNAFNLIYAGAALVFIFLIFKKILGK